MMDVAIVVVRFVQFVGAAVLFGTPLFFLYGIERGTPARWLRPMAAAGAALVAVAAVAGFGLQTAAMAGDPSAVFDRETLSAVATGSAFGAGILARLASAAVALFACLVLRGGSRLWLILSALGAVAMASFAWTGHGAAEAGVAGHIHAAADVAHLLAAGVWLGALAALAGLLTPGRAEPPGNAATLHRALAGFAGVGTAAVAVILASGLVNSWFLVGPSHLLDIGASAYGWLLLIKIGAFVLMLGLAATNRFHLTPDLERGLASGNAAVALAALRRSVLAETLVGLLVLALVSVLGTLPPVAAQ
ncbi:copper homeostasis membrane protein CopD [Caulobacter sp. FWC2]|uniref:copper homeostasis membrane protein CopD n=1 Tax=Caulobacter sp. FWC2 TaxID=69664 RepID=UPI000C14C93C|nr:copper homeostasis membrane protein CopD [Caulobacter sp. FWC2]PIB92816.1 copper resistance protein CopD [Caulobacter sp. FWC2]